MAVMLRRDAQVFEFGPFRLDTAEKLFFKNGEPVDQIVGYLLSGDPTYVTSHRDARTVIRQVDRLLLLEELVRCYVEHKLK